MSLADLALIASGGVAMGFINNLAGGGGLIGIAVLEALAGLPPVAANATIRPSALVIGGSGLLVFRTRGPRIPKRAWLLGLATVPGAICGSIFLVTLPAWVYQTSLLLVVGAMLLGQLAPAAFRLRSTGSATPGLAMALFTLVGVHMGFLQVAVGLLTMLAIGRVLPGDLVAVNATKMAVLICSGLASTVTLAIGGDIRWLPALALAGGCGVGSFLAAHWSLQRGQRAVRAVVLAVCILMLLRLAWTLLA